MCQNRGQLWCWLQAGSTRVLGSNFSPVSRGGAFRDLLRGLTPPSQPPPTLLPPKHNTKQPWRRLWWAKRLPTSRSPSSTAARPASRRCSRWASPSSSTSTPLGAPTPAAHLASRQQNRTHEKTVSVVAGVTVLARIMMRTIKVYRSRGYLPVNREPRVQSLGPKALGPVREPRTGGARETEGTAPEEVRVR